MKKMLAISMAFILLWTTIAFAQNDANRGSDRIVSNFEVLKQVMLRGIDRTVEKLNDWEEKINRHPKISEEDKEEIVVLLNEVETKILEYKAKVEAALTLDELREINKEIKQYLKDNKSAIQEKFKQAVSKVAEKAAQKAEEFFSKADQVINGLKIACPAQKETLEELEAQLSEFEAELEELESEAIPSKDYADMKEHVKNLSRLGKEISRNLKQIKASCLQQTA